MIKKIKVYRDSRNLVLDTTQELGVETDNKVDILRFEFDEFIDGEAELLTNLKGSDGNLLPFKLTKKIEDKSYEIVVTKELLVSNRLTFQLQIVCHNDVIWHSKQNELYVDDVLVVGEGEMPDIVSNWLQNADLRLVEIEESEKIREEAESNRNLNEEIRKTNESERISNEDVRKANEITRKENEVNREKYISDLKQDVADGKFDGEDYILTEQDEDNIADKVKIKLEPDLEANLKASKDYTDNANIFDIKNVEYSQENAVITFTRHDDTKIIIDLPIEMTLKNGYYDSSTKELVLVLMNDQEIRIPASGLIDDYSTQDSTTIQLSISADNVITASIKGQSISKTHLTQELQDEINNKVNNDNYASSDKSGVIKVPDWSGLVVNSSGNLYPDVYTLERYKQRGINLALSKGTIENIKNAYVKEAIQSDEVKEELHNQGFVKDDDLKPLKKNIDDNTDRIKRLEYDIFDYGEAEGTSIHIEDSTYAEAIEIGNEGVSNQKTTNGYNLVKSVSSYKWNNNGSGVSHEFVDDYVKVILLDEPTQYMGIYSLALREDISDLEGEPIVYSFYAKADKNRTIFYQPVGNGRQTYIDLTPNWQRFFFNVESVGSQSPTFYGGTSLDSTPFYIKDIMIEKGSELHDYEEYTGAQQSPNFDYPQDIEVIESGTYNIYTCGNNFIPTQKEMWESGHYNLNGIKADYPTRMRVKELIPIIPNKSYQCIDYQFILRGYDINKNYVQNIGVVSSDRTFITNKDVFYLGVSMDKVYDEYDESISPVIKLENSESNSSEFNQSKIEVTIPEGEFVAEKDELIVEWNEEDREYHKYLIKNIGRGIIDETFTWSKGTASNDSYSVFQTTKKEYDSTIKRIPNAIKSEQLVTENNNVSQEMLNFESIYTNLGISNNYIRISIKNSRLEEISPSGFINFLKNNHIKFYYVLEKPYKVDLGIVDMPKTFTDITNVFSDHPLQPKLYIKNYRDFKKTIKELQDKVQTLETDAIKNTDYATTTNPGIIRVPEFAGLTISEKGSLFPQIYTLEQYGKRDVLTAISKGTLEAVLQPIRDKLEQLSPSINQESEVNNNDLLQE